jgi:hypothetical protein
MNSDSDDSGQLQKVIDTINQKIKEAKVRIISQSRDETKDSRAFWTKSERYLLDVLIDFQSKRIVITAIEYAAYPAKYSFKWENGQFYVAETCPLTDQKFFEAFDRLLTTPNIYS